MIIKNKVTTNNISSMLIMLIVTCFWSACLVPVSVSAAAVKTQKVTLLVGKSKTLSAEATSKKAVLTWTSSKKSVATVSSSGKVTAKAAGKTTVKCVATIGNTTTELLSASVTVKNVAPTVKAMKNAKVGDVVVMGKFDQDLDEENGAEPIEWYVIEKSGKKLLLLSKYVLFGTTFGYGEENNLWGESQIRDILNHDFYKNAFTSAERLSIPYTTHMNYDLPADTPRTEGWVWPDVDLEATVKDKVFLPSFDELIRIFPVSYEYDEWWCRFNETSKYEMLWGYGTPYLFTHYWVTGYNEETRQYLTKDVWEELEGDVTGFATGWLMRTTSGRYWVAGVWNDGTLDRSGYMAHEIRGIRPAIWVTVE